MCFWECWPQWGSMGSYSRQQCRSVISSADKSQATWLCTLIMPLQLSTLASGLIPSGFTFPTDKTGMIASIPVGSVRIKWASTWECKILRNGKHHFFLCHFSLCPNWIWLWIHSLQSLSPLWLTGSHLTSVKLQAFYQEDEKYLLLVLLWRWMKMCVDPLV